VRFFENGLYEFAPRVNILLGRNGYGKTLLLRALAASIQSDLEHGGQLFPPSQGSSSSQDDTSVPILALRVERTGSPEETIRDSVYFRKTAGKIPLLAIPDSRFVDRRDGAFAALGNVEPLAKAGAKHFLSQEPYQDRVALLLAALGGAYARGGESFKRPVFELIQEVTRELTEDGKFAFHSVEIISDSHYKIFVTTSGSEGQPIPIQQASQGTLSVLVIVGQVYYFLESLHSGNDFLTKPGIVLIDEIDAHLHPSWQQKIMGILTYRFPSVQFIVSGHSPLIVAGCDRGEVAVLRRTPADRFEIELLEENFMGARSQDLYRRIFEIEEIDRVYLEYTTKAAAGHARDIEEKIRRAESQLRPTPEELASLTALRRQLYLVRKAEEMRQSRLNKVEMQAQIESLQNEIERLRNQHARAGSTEQ
jgi:hypothetical protein